MLEILNPRHGAILNRTHDCETDEAFPHEGLLGNTAWEDGGERA